MARAKKEQNFRLKRFTNASGTKSWRVVGTKPDGTRVRKNFSNKAEALRTLGDLELEASGEPETRKAHRTSLTPAQLADAEAAVLHAQGQELSKIVPHYLSLLKRVRDKGANLDAAVSFFEGHYREESRAITILNARKAFLKSKVDLTEKSRSNYESTLLHLLKPDPNKLVHMFTVADLEAILDRYPNLNTRRSLRRIFSVFFEWAVRHHHCLENPCRRLDKLPRSSGKIALLTIDEVKRLLFAVTNYRDGVATAPVAIALFAGLRPSEIADLTPGDIRKNGIRVRGGKLRRTMNRMVPLVPNLRSWLKDYPFQGLPDGWDYKLKRLKDATKAKTWVQDVLRHTSISYQAERDRNEGLTAYNNGTSKEMMDRHYRDVIDDTEQVEEFWNLTPARVRSLKIDVTLPRRKKVEWPSKAALGKLVWRKPLAQAAVDLGVSGVALAKHCRKLSIGLPPRGYWLRS